MHHATKLRRWRAVLAFLSRCCSRWGLHWPNMSPYLRWALTSPFHTYHYKWRLFSVALSLRFPSLDVIQHHCSSGARTFLVRCLSTLLYATIQFTLMTILKHSSIFVKKSSVLCCLPFLFMELLSLDIGTKLNITKK